MLLGKKRWHMHKAWICSKHNIYQTENEHIPAIEIMRCKWNWIGYTLQKSAFDSPYRCWNGTHRVKGTTLWRSSVEELKKLTLLLLLTAQNRICWECVDDSLSSTFCFLTNEMNNVRQVWVEIFSTIVLYWYCQNLLDSLLTFTQCHTLCSKSAPKY